jgi:hypothetical protein
MKKAIVSLAAMLCCAFAGGAFAADSKATMDAKAYKAEKDQIEATEKADKKACDPMKGNAKDVCKKEAKAKEKVAKAELDAKNHPGPAADAKVKKVKADTDYDVAKEKCESMKGNEKDVCKKEAKAAHEAAKGEAKVEKAAATSGPAAANAKAKDVKEDTMDAQYSAAKEKCESMKGDAKDKCVADAKKKYNKS